MLGYHVVPADAVAIQARRNLEEYAPGDDSRSKPKIPGQRVPTALNTVVPTCTVETGL
jgi:hypothetical protein